jgi:putative phosphoribosyl transferase
MIFKDRTEAGQKLIRPLSHYKNAVNAVVIGLPRGGVVTAYEVAQGLNLPLDVICPRKIGAPFQSELAIGAITETGEGIFDQTLIDRFSISEDYINKTIEQEKAVAKRRLEMYRKNRPKVPLKGKTVILVDDGLATGATMKAAIQSVKAEGAEKIVVAVPVSPSETLEEIRELADEAIALDTPLFFQAVGQFYEDFSQTEDDEVVSLLQSQS